MRLDGATARGAFRHVVAPMIRSLIAAAGLLLSLPTVLVAVIFHRALLSGLHAFAGGK